MASDEEMAEMVIVEWQAICDAIQEAERRLVAAREGTEHPFGARVTMPTMFDGYMFRELLRISASVRSQRTRDQLPPAHAERLTLEARATVDALFAMTDRRPGGKA